MRSSLLFLSSMLLACVSAPDPESESSSSSSSSSSGSGGSPPACNEADTVCPADKPFPGAPCEGSLSCSYDVSGIAWDFQCLNGRWEGEPDCSMIVGGCGIPEPAEACSSPFEGSLPGATLELGPAEAGAAFRPFSPGEEPIIEWGPQGGAMLFYRVRIDGAEAPSCISITATLTPETMAPTSATRPVRLRCGESLGMYVLLPVGSCGSSPVATTLRVDAPGIGTAEATLTLPPESLCEPI